MQIESIEIKNYRLFRDTGLQNIPRLCVLVGANGTGKSTLFDVFSFPKDALAMNVGKAVSKRGGYKELTPATCVRCSKRVTCRVTCGSGVCSRA